MKKILLTGASGLIGNYLVNELAPISALTAIYNTTPIKNSSVDALCLDITNIAELQKTILSLNPDVIIHLAADSSTSNKSGDERKYTYNLNVSVTESLSILAKEIGAKFIFTSTDLVYAGYRGSLLEEDKKLIPVSFYSETKLVAEQKILNSFSNYIIFRVALNFGFPIGNQLCHFSESIKSLKNGIPIKLFTDQFRTPISIKTTAKNIAIFALNEVSNQIINLGGATRISRYDMFLRAASIFNLDQSLLIPTQMNQIPNFPVVEDVSLNTNKLVSLGGFVLPYETELKSLL